MSAIERALGLLAERNDFYHAEQSFPKDEWKNQFDEDEAVLEAAHAELAELRTENEKLKRAWLATYYEDGNA